MNQICPICGTENTEAVGVYRAKHPVFSGMNRMQCNKCKLVFASPPPSDAVLSKYNASYFNSAHGGKVDRVDTIAFFKAIAKIRIFYVENYLNNNDLEASSLLEIGPGMGFFATGWLDRHPQTKYVAIETDMSCHEALQDIGVSVLEEFPSLDDQMCFDMIVMSHVLEHVSNPNAFIRMVTQALCKDGVLFIEVPCRDWEHKPIDEPHLLFFDKKPMEDLLKRVGFKNIKISYHGREIENLKQTSVFEAKWNVIRSILIRLGIIAPFTRIENGLEMLVDPLERAVVKPFEAHSEKKKPAWWLRAIACKAQ